jgi:DNA-directed RNA polymerase specialized sigma24 family protein
MKRDESETVAINGEESLAVQRNLPSAQLSPAVEPAAAHNALSNGMIEELLHQALVQGNQDAWAELQRFLGETVLRWLHTHPSKEAACRLESEEHYVGQAFERLRRAAIEGQVVFETQASALVYLRTSLNGTILDSLRAYSRPRAVPVPLPGAPSGPYFEDRTTSLELWEILQKALSSVREQRLAYLLYHCGLGPREIVRFCQEEWTDVQEIYRLRRSILERLLRQTD